MILTENGKLTRGKKKGRLVADLCDGELVASVNGFNPSPNATRSDREYLAAEMRRRTLPIPAGFVEGRAIRRKSDNGSSATSKSVANGSSNRNNHKSNGEGGSMNRINGSSSVATKPRSKTNGKPKRQHSEPEDGVGVIHENAMYSSEAFRARLSSGRGPMARDTLTDWIDRGLRVGYLIDGRMQIRGRRFLEWVERECRPEPESASEPSGSEKKLPSGQRGLLIDVVRTFIDLQKGMLSAEMDQAFASERSNSAK